jgi:hypothetical protein
MSTDNMGVAFSFNYGRMPEEINEFQPRMFVINGSIPVGGLFQVDLTECVNRELLGHIQSCILTMIRPATNGQMTFVHGTSGVRFSVCNMVADGAHDAKIVFPFMSPQNTLQHNLLGPVDYPFQLVFTNVPFPIACTGSGAF